MKKSVFFIAILANLFLMGCQINPDTSHSNDSELEFELTVDYSRTLVRIIDDGKYYYVNSIITEKNFPRPVEVISHKITVHTKVFKFNGGVSNSEIISIMEKAGYRPATLNEILALVELAEVETRLWDAFPVVAVGSIWRDHRGFQYAPTIEISSNMRYLSINRYRLFNRGWSSYWKFLAIKV